MKSKILDRVCKLLSKVSAAKGSDCEAIQNEAQASLQAATALMEKHGITQSDVARINEDSVEITSDSIVERYAYKSSRVLRHDSWIAAAVGQALDCRAIRTASGIVFIGVETDCLAAGKILLHLKEKLNAAVREYKREIKNPNPLDPPDYSDPKERVLSFKDGFCMALIDTGRDIAEERRAKQEQVPAGNALVPINQLQDAKLSAIMERMRQMNLRAAKRPDNFRNAAAEMQGYSQGSKLHFGKDTLE